MNLKPVTLYRVGGFGLFPEYTTTTHPRPTGLIRAFHRLVGVIMEGQSCNRENAEGVYDGFVSRHLNRRVSRPMARLLARTRVTPNQVSIVSLVLAVACLGCFVSGYYIVGAFLAQASSIADGIDGDLARFKKMHSAFGGFMDAILDRYADSLILLGLTIWAAADSGIITWVVGFWALSGMFTVTYTRARINVDMGRPFDRGITSAASRDVRLIIVMLGGLLGQGLVTLVVLAVLTHTVVFLRLMAARRILK
jgi:phosphatidylglycerophosphate synthase